jgi:hypothetical protein
VAEITLYCLAQSGNAYKPALALELAGADWAPRFVDFLAGETRTPACRALNVMGEVPMLEYRGALLADEIEVDWAAHPAIRDRLARVQSEPRWGHPCPLLPGHPLPAAG